MFRDIRSLCESVPICHQSGRDFATSATASRYNVIASADETRTCIIHGRNAKPLGLPDRSICCICSASHLLLASLQVSLTPSLGLLLSSTVFVDPPPTDPITGKTSIMSQEFWKDNTVMAKQYDSMPSGVASLPVLPAIELVGCVGVPLSCTCLI